MQIRPAVFSTHATRSISCNLSLVQFIDEQAEDFFHLLARKPSLKKLFALHEMSGNKNMQKVIIESRKARYVHLKKVMKS
jgi:hypothetical protein